MPAGSHQVVFASGGRWIRRFTLLLGPAIAFLPAAVMAVAFLAAVSSWGDLAWAGAPC